MIFKIALPKQLFEGLYKKIFIISMGGQFCNSLKEERKFSKLSKFWDNQLLQKLNIILPLVCTVSWVYIYSCPTIFLSNLVDPWESIFKFFYKLSNFRKKQLVNIFKIF